MSGKTPRDQCGRRLSPNDTSEQWDAWHPLALDSKIPAVLSTRAAHSTEGDGTLDLSWCRFNWEVLPPPRYRPKRARFTQRGARRRRPCGSLHHAQKAPWPILRLSRPLTRQAPARYRTAARGRSRERRGARQSRSPLLAHALVASLLTSPTHLPSPRWAQGSGSYRTSACRGATRAKRYADTRASWHVYACRFLHANEIVGTRGVACDVYPVPEPIDGTRFVQLCRLTGSHLDTGTRVAVTMQFCAVTST
jgi:hypothetical protein